MDIILLRVFKCFLKSLIFINIYNLEVKKYLWVYFILCIVYCVNGFIIDKGEIKVKLLLFLLWLKSILWGFYVEM